MDPIDRRLVDRGVFKRRAPTGGRSSSASSVQPVARSYNHICVIVCERLFNSFDDFRQVRLGLGLGQVRLGSQ